jgi:REP element-mobilizing transposase RayT
VNHLKGVSSRMLRKEFPELAAHGAHLWTPN